MWICHAERPLQVDELRHALAVEIGAADFDTKNAPSIGALLSCCQGLITVDKESSTVRLIHLTVQDYICSHTDLFSHPHSVIAKSCLTYLNSRQVKNLPSYPHPSHQYMPFLKYSSRYWGSHAKREFSVYVGALALRLLSLYENHPSAVSLLQQVLPAGYPLDASSPHHFSGLHCASFFGTHQLVAALMNAKGYEINQGDCAGNTPLLWAVRNGHYNAVKLLLAREDVDPERPDSQDVTPLLWAAYNGYEEVVKLLLGREDIEPNRPDNQGCTPLFWAANNGHEGAVKLLLEHRDVDPNLPEKNNQTPLRAAAFEGREGAVKLLLGREDVDPNRSGLDGATPLACAAAMGYEGVVKLLLDRNDVDPNCLDKYDRTPIGLAASKGYEGVVDLLLGREDINPDRPDGNGRTPLACAAMNGHKAVVKFLQARISMQSAIAQPPCQL